MTDQTLGKGYSNFINILLFTFPVIINSVKVAGDLVLLILTITGIYVAISHKTSPFKVKELKLFSWMTIGYFLLVVLSIIFSGKAAELSHFISRELHFLFAPFVAFAIFKAKINFTQLLLGIKFALIVSGIIIFNQYLAGVDRPSGMMHVELFGHINVLLLFFSISKFFEETLWERIFTLTAFSVGLAVMILNGTRGAWVVFIILAIIYLWLIYRQYFLYNKKVKIMLMAGLAIIILGLTTTKVVQDRTSLAIAEYSEWVSGNSEPSSIGLRLEMWKSGLQAINDHFPIMGYGYRNTNIVASEFVDERVKEKISHFNHLHNDYLTHLMSMGILGLVSILILLFAPLSLFIKNSRNEGVFIHTSMGIFLCTGYAIFGLFNVVFGDVFMNAFYVLFIATLLPRVIVDKLDKIT